MHFEMDLSEKKRTSTEKRNATLAGQLHCERCAWYLGLDAEKKKRAEDIYNTDYLLDKRGPLMQAFDINFDQANEFCRSMDAISHEATRLSLEKVDDILVGDAQPAEEEDVRDELNSLQNDILQEGAGIPGASPDVPISFDDASASPDVPISLEDAPISPEAQEDQDVTACNCCSAIGISEEKLVRECFATIGKYSKRSLGCVRTNCGREAILLGRLRASYRGIDSDVLEFPDGDLAWVRESDYQFLSIFSKTVEVQGLRTDGSILASMHLPYIGSKFKLEARMMNDRPVYEWLHTIIRSIREYDANHEAWVNKWICENNLDNRKNRLCEVVDDALNPCEIVGLWKPTSAVMNHDFGWADLAIVPVLSSADFQEICPWFPIHEARSIYDGLDFDVLADTKQIQKLERIDAIDDYLECGYEVALAIVEYSANYFDGTWYAPDEVLLIQLESGELFGRGEGYFLLGRVVTKETFVLYQYELCPLQWQDEFNILCGTLSADKSHVHVKHYPLNHVAQSHETLITFNRYATPEVQAFSLAANGDIDELRYMIEKEEVDITTNKARCNMKNESVTYLERAIRNKQDEMVFWLLENNADVEDVNPQILMPYQLAIRDEQTPWMKLVGVFDQFSGSLKHIKQTK